MVAGLGHTVWAQPAAAEACGKPGWKQEQHLFDLRRRHRECGTLGLFTSCSGTGQGGRWLLHSPAANGGPTRERRGNGGSGRQCPLLLPPTARQPHAGSCSHRLCSLQAPAVRRGPSLSGHRRCADLWAMSSFDERLLLRHASFKKGIEAGDMQQRLRELAGELWRQDHEDKLWSRRSEGFLLEQQLVEQPAIVEVDLAGEADAMMVEDLLSQLPRVRSRLLADVDPSGQLDALRLLRSLLGDLPSCLVTLAETAEVAEIRVEAMAALADLACSSVEKALLVAESGALPLCVRLLQSADEALGQESFRALQGVRQTAEIF
eukprot:s1803_g4.t1